METCDQCHRILIEIDNYGQRLIGCYKCNKWRQLGEIDFTRKLPEKDFAALRKIDAEETSTADAVFQVYAAKQTGDAIESYIARGRRFQMLSDTDLAEVFREGVRQWAADLRGANQLSDVIAEYELRGAPAPTLNTIPEYAVIRVALARALEDMSEEQMNEIAAEIRAVHANVKKRRL